MEFIDKSRLDKYSIVRQPLRLPGALLGYFKTSLEKQEDLDLG